LSGAPLPLQFTLHLGAEYCPACERICWCVYEVWAFTHGRRTMIDSSSYEPTEVNTRMRVFGFAVDLLIWGFCAWHIVM
jgi:hypothetical protein